MSGFGAQNIGNVFFNVGGLHVLREVFPERNVQFIQDQPGYWTFNRARQNHRNYCNLLSRLDVDYIVLQGPVFSATLPKLWDYTLGELYKKGTKVIYLSSALFKYTPEEIEITKRFLEKYPPAFISTRDARSYEVLKDLHGNVYKGICSAWFVPDVYDPVPMDMGKFAVMNFDRMPEPNISVLGNTGVGGNGADSFEFDDKTWNIDWPSLQRKLSVRGKASAYIGAFLDFRKLPAELGGYPLIRTEHRTNPHFSWKIYGQPGGLASDEPYTYFSVYGNSALTLSDRVHACVMTLAYGNPAMLFSLSPRSALFDRLGLDDIRNRPVTLDLDYLEQEKGDLITALQGFVKSNGL